MQDANRTAIGYTRELGGFNIQSPALPGVAVGGTATLQAMRYTKASMKHTKDTVVSAEIFADRMIRNLIKVGIETTGSTEHEIATADYDDLIACATMADDFAALTLNCDLDHVALTIVKHGGGNAFAALLGAKYIRVAGSGTPANNGMKAVVSVTAATITFAPGSFTADDTNVAFTFSVNYVTAVDSVTATITGNNILTATVGAFSAATQGARYVKIAGATTGGNNGIKKVVSCTGTVLTCVANAFPQNEAGDTVTVTVNYIRTGTTLNTMLIQEQFTDAAEWMAYTGQAIDTAEFKLDSKAKGVLTLAFMGYQGIARTAALNNAALLGPSSNPIVNTTDNIGGLLANNSAITNPVKTLSLKIANNLRQRPAIGEPSSLKYGAGYSEITGQLDVYFTDGALLASFISHTPMALEYPTIDALGNVLNVFLPSVQYSDGSPDITGVNTDVMQSLPFQALRDPTLQYQLQIDRLAA